jgi:hypothetical protein
MNLGYSSLANLAKLRPKVKRKRISSSNPEGTNLDLIPIKPNEKYVLCDILGSGCIKHIWTTLASKDPYYLRKAIIRMWWDGEKNPSVECPVGDFFGVGHSKSTIFWSLPLCMAPEDGKGFNCFFPMPFSSRARIEIENETDLSLVCYYYIDYEEYEDSKDLDKNYGRFHVMWHRENPCKGNDYETSKIIERNSKKNKTHENDYILLDAEGEGHYVGCHLDIYNLRDTDEHNWPGEGDDYIEIDNGESILYGTGTEDYFCTSWCPTQTYSSPYFGITLPGERNWSGEISYYRYHIEDPIYFHKNIKVKLEHGHANQRSDDWSSTVYWYQKEPHKKFKELLPSEERIPR